MPTKEIPTFTYEEWMTEGKRRFGEKFDDWKFECSICGNIAAVGDYKPYKDKGADPNSATCECIGRYTGATDFAAHGKGPCNYALYGLFKLPGMVVEFPDGKKTNSFAFASGELA